MPFTETDPEVEATEMLSSACDWEVKPKSIPSRDTSGASGTAPNSSRGETGRRGGSNYSGVLGKQSQYLENLKILFFDLAFIFFSFLVLKVEGRPHTYSMSAL